MRVNDKEKYLTVWNELSMNNLKEIIRDKKYSITKVAIHTGITERTIVSYINHENLPSVVTLVSLSKYLNCNLEFLLDMTNNPTPINSLNEYHENVKTNLLIQTLLSLSKEQQRLVEAYIKGLQSNN